MIIKKEIVVVYTEQLLLEEQREQLRKRMSIEFPGMKVAIVDGGASVEFGPEIEEFVPDDPSIEEFNQKLREVERKSRELVRRFLPEAPCVVGGYAEFPGWGFIKSENKNGFADRNEVVANEYFRRQDEKTIPEVMTFKQYVRMRKASRDIARVEAGVKP